MGESLLSSEQQKAVKTNRRRAVGHFCLIFLLFVWKAEDDKWRIFRELFFSVDDSEVTGVDRRCVKEFQQVTRIKMTGLFLS